MYILAIILTCTGFVALAVVAVTKWFYVVPFMRRRHGMSAVFKGFLGLGFGLSQDLEYMRLAREGDSEKHKRAAFVMKVATTVFFVDFVLLAIAFLIDLYIYPPG